MLFRDGKGHGRLRAPQCYSKSTLHIRTSPVQMQIGLHPSYGQGHAQVPVLLDSLHEAQSPFRHGAAAGPSVHPPELLTAKPSQQAGADASHTVCTHVTTNSVAGAVQGSSVGTPGEMSYGDLSFPSYSCRLAHLVSRQHPQPTHKMQPTSSKTSGSDAGARAQAASLLPPCCLSPSCGSPAGKSRLSPPAPRSCTSRLSPGPSPGQAGDDCPHLSPYLAGTLAAEAGRLAEQQVRLLHALPNRALAGGGAAPRRKQAHVRGNHCSTQSFSNAGRNLVTERKSEMRCFKYSCLAPRIRRGLSKGTALSLCLLEDTRGGKRCFRKQPGCRAQGPKLQKERGGK